MVDLIDRIIANPSQPFAMISRELDGIRRVELLILERLTEQSISGSLGLRGSHHFGTLLVLPFRQVLERGFQAVDDGTEIYALPIRERTVEELPVILDKIPDVDLRFSNPSFDIEEIEFSRRVLRLIETEIAEGAGSNFVLHRKLAATLHDYTPAHLLTMLKRLLIGESNAHWVFAIHTGDHAFVGASPEQHVGLRDSVLTMNPISGTISRTAANDREELLSFLSDEKEISELFMVVDEELKSMSRLCPDGVRVDGPHLQWLRHVVHTEYKLAGYTSAGIPEILRESIPMPTVTGSPVRSACEVISNYEPQGRGYYSGVIALIEGHEPNVALDSVIGIRTAEISMTGQMRIGAGATIVRDSHPEREAAETAAKAESVFSTLAAQPFSLRTDEVEKALTSRNERLSEYWLTEPARRAAIPRYMEGLRTLVVDAQDTFTWMLCTLLRSSGASVEVRSVEELKQGGLHPERFDFVVAGPGPGDPRDENDSRIDGLRQLINRLLTEGTPFLAVCLSHQVLCSILGIPVLRLAKPNQGTQRLVNLAGTSTLAGFYNSYAGNMDSKICKELQTRNITAITASRSNELDGLLGPTFASVQFHLESILTVNGPEILQELLRPILDRVQDRTGTEVLA